MTERPRDAAGRPLPFGSAGVEPVHPDPGARPTEIVDHADNLIAEGRPFAAHEVLEEAWKNRGEAERELWRGLAQLAVGLTHLQRGNIEGGSRLLRRGAGELQAASAEAADLAAGLGVDLATLISQAQALADEPQWPHALRLRSGS